MTEDEFWKIIDRAIETSNNDPDKKLEILKEELEKLSSDDIISFGTYFDQKDADSYRWDLWAAAYTIHLGCSDDAFSDFRASLICLGKNAYEGALEFPDSLAKFNFDNPDESLFFEGYQYLPSEAYETET